MPDASAWGEIAALITVLLAVGGVAGIVAGLLGVGGGIVIVPALYYVFSALKYPEASLMHVCVATSLATIIFTSARSVASHDKKGAVDWALLRAWAPWVMLGAISGALFADLLKTRALMGIFGAVAFCVALNMLFGGTRARLGGGAPQGMARAGWSLATGFLSALMGVGGGTFGVTILTLYGVPIHRAVATSAGLGMLIAAPSVIGFVATGLDVVAKPPFTLGYVNLAAFAVIVPMTVLCAPLGVRLAHSMNPKLLKMAFAFFLAVTALNMLRKALGL